MPPVNRITAILVVRPVPAVAQSPASRRRQPRDRLPCPSSRSRWPRPRRNPCPPNCVWSAPWKHPPSCRSSRKSPASFCASASPKVRMSPTATFCSKSTRVPTRKLSARPKPTSRATAPRSPSWKPPSPATPPRPNINQSDADRYAELAKAGVVSRSQSDQAKTSADVARESARATQAGIESAKAALESDLSAVGHCQAEPELLPDPLAPLRTHRQPAGPRRQPGEGQRRSAGGDPSGLAHLRQFQRARTAPRRRAPPQRQPPARRQRLRPGRSPPARRPARSPSSTTPSIPPPAPFT